MNLLNPKKAQENSIAAAMQHLLAQQSPADENGGGLMIHKQVNKSDSKFIDSWCTNQLDSNTHLTGIVRTPQCVLGSLRWLGGF